MSDYDAMHQAARVKAFAFQMLGVIQLLGEACACGEGDTIDVVDWDKLRAAYIEGGLIIQNIFEEAHDA